MATTTSPNKIANIKADNALPPSESLFQSALKRLLRNRFAVMGIVIIILFLLIAVFANVIAPYPYDQTALRASDSMPTWVSNLFGIAPKDAGGYAKINEDYSLGADNLGRDIFSRIVYGSRVSLAVAFVGPVVAIIVGLTLGLVSGFFGGVVDNIIMRITDIMYAFPTLLLIILFMAVFRPSTGSLENGTFAYSMNRLDASTGGMLFIFIGVGITSWMQLARLTRGQVLSTREMDYVQAARSLGATDRTIMLRHVLPNILGPLIVAETLTIPRYISYEAFLSFIGLGVNPPTPSWGAMISEGAPAIRSYPHQAIFPAVTLFLIMFAFNFLGDGLRDALDPRMRGSS
jgi:oligopeptide transport system permease protein